MPPPINTPTFLVDAKPLAHRRQTSPICRRCCASPDGNGCRRRSTGTRAGRGAANPFGVEVSGDRVSSAPILEVGAANVLIPWHLAAQSHTHRRQRFTSISDRLLHCCEMTLCALATKVRCSKICISITSSASANEHYSQENRRRNESGISDAACAFWSGAKTRFHSVGSARR